MKKKKPILELDRYCTKKYAFSHLTWILIDLRILSSIIQCRTKPVLANYTHCMGWCRQVDDREI